MLAVVARRAPAFGFRPLQLAAAKANQANSVSQRFFAASPLDTTAKLYEDLVDKSVKEYQSNQQAVASDLDAELAANKVVLFMEGTPDAPKSEPSLNVVKMLTESQVVPLMAVDVLAHPAILGYTVSKSSKRRAPHLYVNGSFYADYDGLMAQHSSGQLAKSLGTEATKSTGTFGGELPIATY
eukprot:TRINITY_DN17964_c0_g1_i2.p1 TRINITY_DN17964_c0_g1~~TRINITY_DN17964_c0_g1_i2.p1  ORF type:complete len:183 (-),score=40.93 TRINITY_DN17964_c0_g1_i2:80-628(-)